MSTACPLPAGVPEGTPTFGLGLPCPRLVPSLPFLSASTAYSTHCFAGLLHPAAGHGVRHVSSSCGSVFSVRDPVHLGGVTTTSVCGVSALSGRAVAASSPGRLLLPVGSTSISFRRVLPRSFCPLRSRRSPFLILPAASPRRSRPSSPCCHVLSGWQSRRCRRCCAEAGPGSLLPPSPFPVAPHPSELFPASVAAPRHRGRCLLAVAPRLAVRPVTRLRVPGWMPCPWPSTSRPCSPDESVAPRSVAAPHCSMLPWACVSSFKAAPLRFAGPCRRDSVLSAQRRPASSSHTLRGRRVAVRRVSAPGVPRADQCDGRLCVVKPGPGSAVPARSLPPSRC